MSTFKKLLALTLALAMVLSVSAFAGNYSANTYADADKINEDCEDAIELLYALDIMKGDGKNFNPEASVTRAEMAKMIYVILNYGDDDKAATYAGGKFFADVADGAWYEGYVNYAAATKLVQGRPDGTFGPMDPVTTAEAAKMLLTAIGYSAEAREYTGANWAKNVLSDAAIIGLLDGYKSNVNTFAPRQWVAVMMENALSAYTYTTMAPSFSGLLTSGDETGITKMMTKYLGATEVKGYLTGINGYTILEDGKTCDSGEVVFDDEIVVEADATIADLGQQFKAIIVECEYDDESGDLVSGEALSFRNTGKSVVAEDEVKDVEWELTYATSANNEKNVYEFTVGEFAGKLNYDSDEKARCVHVLNVVAGEDEGEIYEAKDLQDAVKAAKIRNDVVRAIDKDGDGDLDYVVYTPVDYAVVTKVGTSQKYGDYIKAEDMNDKPIKLGDPENATLYIDSCILTEDELDVDNFIKFSYNIDEDMYNVEVLPVAEAVEFESRKINKDQYTFGGETYAPATNGHNTLEDELTATGDENPLGDDYDIVVDGDLLVYIVETETSTNLDEINEKLAVIIKTDIRNVDDENTKQVKLLTIDGEQAWYTYDVTGANKAAGKADGETVFTWSDIKGEEKNDVWSCDNWDKLVIVSTNDDGEVYLREVVEGDLYIDKKNNVVDFVDIDEATLDADGTPTLENDDNDIDYRVAGDNKFFAYIDDEYTVITVNELEEGEYEDIEYTALVENGKYYDTVLGGYLKIGDAVYAEDGYLFVIDTDEREDEDDGYIVVLMQATGEEVELPVSEIKDVEDLEENVCYFYEYDGEEYVLTAVAEEEDFAKLIVEEGDELYYDTKKVDKYDEPIYKGIDATDYDYIAVVTQENLREEDDDRWEVEIEVPEFIDAETLAEKLNECLAMLDEDDYTYSFEYYYAEYEDVNEDEILWVVIVQNMVDNATEDAE